MQRSSATLRVGSPVLAFVAIACPAAAFAQDQTAASADVQCANLSTEEERTRCAAEGGAAIVVTGSRLRQPELSSPNPIHAYTAETIEQSGETNLTELLSTTPSLQGSNTSQVGANLGSGVIGLQGLNALDLRNLGLNRTLILVNGRRHVVGDPISGAVDINTMPTDLVERVDVMTGGASAIYGADAVSGVVNFVLKRNFEGIQARGQIGISDRGAAGERFGSIVAGHNFAGGRGNIAAAYEYSAMDRLTYAQRGFGPENFQILSRDASDIPDDPNRPDNILFSDVRKLDASEDGAIDVGRIVNGVFVPGAFDGIPDFTGSGLPYDRGRLIIADGVNTVGGSSRPRAGFFGDVLPRIERHNVNLLTSFEVTPAFRLFAEGKFARSDSFTVRNPSVALNLFLAPDNPFVQQRFGALGVAGVRIVDRENVDLFGSNLKLTGNRAAGSKRNTYRGVIGADGRLSDHLRYELSYVYGLSDIDLFRHGEPIRDRFFAAADVVINPATGQPTCRVNLNPAAAPAITFRPGECLPLNLLGINAPSAATEWVRTDLRTDVKITQNVVSGHLAGDLGGFFELPGGPIAFALGAEYRKERTEAIRGRLEEEGLTGFVQARFVSLVGEYDVREAFAEVSIPLLRDLPFAHLLSVGGAIRFSDYSTVGNTFAWKVDGVYAPVPDVSFRGTYSQAVRAPNVQELFAPQSNTFLPINDPCHFERRTSGTSFRSANCQAALTAAGLTPAQIAAFTGVGVQRPGLTGGNPDLIEETAKTWTAGVVLRPRFLPGFTATVDWYDIKIEDAIAFAGAQTLVELCVDQPTLNNIFCPNITREQGTGLVSSFFTGPANVASFETNGLEFTLNYRFSPSPGIGTFNLRAMGGYLHKLETIAIPGAVPFDSAGDPYRPRYSGNLDLTWYKGPLTLNYGLTWFSHTRRVSELTKAARPDFSDPSLFWFKERWTHDIRIAYDVDNRFTIYAGVNDFLDQKASPAAESPDITFPGTATGRFLYVGAKVKFDRLSDVF